MWASLIKYSVLKKIMTKIHSQRSYEGLLSSHIVFSEACACKNLAQVLFPVQNTVLVFLATEKDLYVTN